MKTHLRHSLRTNENSKHFLSPTFCRIDKFLQLLEVTLQAKSSQSASSFPICIKDGAFLWKQDPASNDQTEDHGSSEECKQNDKHNSGDNTDIAFLNGNSTVSYAVVPVLIQK